jgi:hypothetical protein
MNCLFYFSNDFFVRAKCLVFPFLHDFNLSVKHEPVLCQSHVLYHLYLVNIIFLLPFHAVICTINFSIELTCHLIQSLMRVIFIFDDFSPLPAVG